MNPKSQKIIVILMGTSMLATPSFSAEKDDDDELKTSIMLRPRVEIVDQNTITERADAGTLLTRIALEKKLSNEFKINFEVDDVSAFIDDYNGGAGTTPDRGNFPVVADPVGTEINLATLTYKASSDTEYSIGRRRININNQRFVGGVAWRQNEQTYDSIGVSHTYSDDLAINYSYVWNINRIFGETVNAGDHQQSTSLFEASYSGVDNHRLSLYFFDIDNDDAAAFSTTTAGLRVEGKQELLKYNLEFATQSDNTNNPVDYTANYYLAEAFYPISDFTAGIGLEVLEGQSNTAGGAFRTPLSTLHKFNGWADLFLVTPDQGIEDTYISAKTTIEGYSATVIFHDFKSNAGSGSYGDEIDFLLTKAIDKQTGFLFKYANFSGDNGFPDRQVAWVMVTYKM
ncbi:MAG: alginate export family protein [Kangiellaceae bacterium]|jgi:hypothetical protein|nr:alginate export family protein [Kangiellaceae bacterium]